MLVTHRRWTGDVGRWAGSLPFRAVLLLALVGLAGCQSAGLYTPPARSLVNSAGARLYPDQERMNEVDRWVQDMVETIQLDPSFLLVSRIVPEPAYPWETLDVVADDSVVIAFEPTLSEVETPYQIYAFLHLMDRVDRLPEFFPEAQSVRGEWELERFILNKVADSWLLGRSTYDTSPYPVLDELIYAQDAGMLDPMILYFRGDEFPSERERYLDFEPGGLDAFADWYRTTFGREPPEVAGA